MPLLRSLLLLSSLLMPIDAAWSADPLDIAIVNGRVMDPESGLDRVLNVGVHGGRVAALSDRPLAARETVDATGLVVAPGFINLHWHGTDPRSDAYQALDGVTSSFELEVGVDDVDRWYEERAGRMLINYGVAVGHAPARMAVMHDPGELLPAGEAARREATPEEIDRIAQRVQRGLARGAVGVGFALAYTPAESRWEILQMFRIAAVHRAAAFVHIRGASSAGSADREQGLLEAIAHSAVSGASVHIAHINSSGQGAASRMLDIMRDARARGIDITTECYPYTAGATRIESFLFDSWMDKPESDYATLQWAATGERLTRESFVRYRKQGGLVLIHANTEDNVHEAVIDPLTMFASDGFDVYPGNGHPRSAGTYTRVLSRYVRQQKALPLMEALRKMTVMPAQRLEARVPQMRDKGRLRVGADADIVIFDSASVEDRATYEQPAVHAQGVRFVLVGGRWLVRDGRVVEGATPGQSIRAPLQ